VLANNRRLQAPGINDDHVAGARERDCMKGRAQSPGGLYSSSMYKGRSRPAAKKCEMSRSRDQSVPVAHFRCIDSGGTAESFTSPAMCASRPMMLTASLMRPAAMAARARSSRAGRRTCSDAFACSAASSRSSAIRRFTLVCEQPRGGRSCPSISGSGVRQRVPLRGRHAARNRLRKHLVPGRGEGTSHWLTP
jgi:hypothetical protein